MAKTFGQLSAGSETHAQRFFIDFSCSHYAKIKPMKSTMSLSQRKAHPSYQMHRSQVWTQILLPILIAAAIFVAVIVLTTVSTFRNQGDVARWAAISTIWLVLPVMVAGLLILILLIATIYLVTRLMGLIPPYSFQAQRIFYRIETGTKRVADMIARPVLFLEVISTQIRNALNRK